MAKVNSTDYEANLINQMSNTMQLLASTMEMYQENIESLIVDYQQARRRRETEEEKKDS